MLIPVAELVAEHGLRGVSGVLHLGAHFGEEADAYDADMPWTGDPLVIWVEGDDRHYDRLHEHVGHRDGHHIITVAVDDHEHFAVLNLASNEGASSSLLELGTHAVEHPHITFVGKRRVHAITVDQLHLTTPQDAALERINFVTLDLQGLELRALRGAARLLDHVDYIFTEVNRAPLYVGCPMVEEIDAHLVGFDRVATAWTDWGWGDAFYRRTA